MRLRISHTLGVISLVSAYDPTGISEFSAKEALPPVPDGGGLVSKGNTFIVLGDFNATTGTDRDGYESCVGPHGSGSRNESSSMLLDFAKSRRMRLAGSWFQRLDLHRWTWLWCKERDRTYIRRRSLETSPELQCFSERRVKSAKSSRHMYLQSKTRKGDGQRAFPTGCRPGVGPGQPD